MGLNLVCESLGHVQTTEEDDVNKIIVNRKRLIRIRHGHEIALSFPLDVKITVIFISPQAISV